MKEVHSDTTIQCDIVMHSWFGRYNVLVGVC